MHKYLTTETSVDSSKINEYGVLLISFIYFSDIDGTIIFLINYEHIVLCNIKLLNDVLYFRIGTFQSFAKMIHDF